MRRNRRLAATLLACLALATHAALAQQPAPGGWQTGTEVNKAPPRETAPPAGGFNTTVVPRSAPEPKATPGLGDLTLSAILTEDGEAIDQGIVWRVFHASKSATPAATGATPAAAAAADAKSRLVGTWREAAPHLRLPPGDYLVNASFGRAHLTRKITLAAGASLREQFVINAGGLRVTAVLAGGEPAPADAVSFDIYAGEGDQSGARTKVMSGAKPGLIVRLNAGIYQLVSTYGDANAIVRADVTVEPGKLSEAMINHLAAKVTFKLVTRAGGEALADTQWSLQTAQGEAVRESMGALPTYILAAGSYVVSAKNGGRVAKREFAVAAGEPAQVELVMR